jgi:hypothetical protein
MKADTTYTQPTKIQVRERLLAHAVWVLTEGRYSGLVVRENEFDAVINYASNLIKKYGGPTSWTSELPIQTKRWHDFQRALVGQRRPSELRVLYLAGPEPRNDLQLLMHLGVLPENIWAVEADGQAYNKAVSQLCEHNVFIRIHHGTLEGLFSTINTRFDIVYIDACGPLPGGKPATLPPIRRLLEHGRLSELSVLITNFAQPPAEKADDYTELMANYFASRYNDVPTALFEAGLDPAHGQYEIDYVKRYVEQNFDETYSDFVTRFLVDLARDLLPSCLALANTDLREKLFIKKSAPAVAYKKATAGAPFPQPDEDDHAYWRRFFDETGQLTLAPSSYPLLHFVHIANESRLLTSLLHAPGANRWKISELYPQAALLTNLVAGYVEIASDEIRNAIRQTWFDYHYSCDKPFPNLIINSIIGIYGYPYHVNPAQSLRIRYTAKKTPMYSDCLVLDQCRYFYDYLPTIDLIPARFKSLAYQLVLRANMDCFARHDFASSSHPFKYGCWTGIAQIEEAQAYDFGPRETL